MTHYVLAVMDWLDFSWLWHSYNKFIENIARKRAVQTTINELRELSDKDLNDIGISRSDIRAVAEGIFYRA